MLGNHSHKFDFDEVISLCGSTPPCCTANSMLVSAHSRAMCENGLHYYLRHVCYSCLIVTFT